MKQLKKTTHGLGIQRVKMKPQAVQKQKRCYHESYSIVMWVRPQRHLMLFPRLHFLSDSFFRCKDNIGKISTNKTLPLVLEGLKVHLHG